MRERIVYRSAITGQFVSREYAESHPDTTIRQVIQLREPES